jgi:hypothetical protein
MGVPLHEPGSGRYDDLCKYVCEQSHAGTAVVVVINGRLGSGFSVQGHLPDLRRLPDMLDNLALAIRLDVGKMDSGQGA